MRRTIVLFLLSALFLATFAACAGKSRQVARIEFVEEGDYGEGLFIVEPIVLDTNKCAIWVNSEKGMQEVSCNSSYLVGCDIANPEDKPFCTLVREIGPERVSSYPKTRR